MSSMPEEQDRKSGFLAFWTTLPGILTGLAALITAVVGAIGLWKSQSGGSGSPATTAAAVTTTPSQGTTSAKPTAGRLSLVRGDAADLERGRIGNSTDADLSFGSETTPTLHYVPPSFFAPVDTRPTRAACVAALRGRRDTSEVLSDVDRKWICVSTTEGDVAFVRVVSEPGVGSAKLVLAYKVWS
jgi:hypothetical protein